ncbi:glutathione binding-like protein, partial [Aeromonas veronii]|uniref:glutathione binding-like protein n=1 Tax=Aeromonas veronii TaxID=654 RepID=UPI000AEF282D
VLANRHYLVGDRLSGADIMNSFLVDLLAQSGQLAHFPHLQAYWQRLNTHPAHAAIILSLETVFAAVGGVLLLGETLDERAIAGCALMLAGMLISQIRLRWWWKSRRDKVPATK